MNLFSDEALKWLCQILEERFGLTFMLEQSTVSLSLRLVDEYRGYIVFPELEPGFHQPHSNLDYTEWDGVKEGWRSVLGKPLPAPGVSKIHQPLIEKKDSSHIIHYDLLGLAYWMLNRVEEIDRSDLDSHGRFPAINSHSYRYGYLERPVVDEWLELLGQVIKKQWPHVKIRQHKFQLKVSHDVDTPSLYAFQPWKKIIRMMAGHLLKRGDIKAFFQSPYLKLMTGKTLHKHDPFNTFDWLMDVSENNNIKSAFYFICGRTDPEKDADYEIEHPIMRNLLRRIHERGHEVGLHPSYNTFVRSGLIKQEHERLKNVCLEEGINQNTWGGRMHYLRWQQPTTMRAWAYARADYDSTLGYADRPGFRCGTCFEYSAFDPVCQERIPLRIRPLIVMECTVLSDAYLGLGLGSLSQKKIIQMKNTCRKVNGTFSLLWHNSYFTDPKLKKLYLSILER